MVVVSVPRKRRTTTLQRDKSKHGFIVKSNTMDPPTAPIFLPLFHCTENGTVRWDEFTLFLESSSHRNYTQRDHHHHPHWIPVARSVVVSANRAKVVVFFVTVVWEDDKDYTDRLTDWRWWWKEHHGNASVHSECNCSLRWYSFLVLCYRCRYSSAMKPSIVPPFIALFGNLFLIHHRLSFLRLPQSNL